MFFFDADGQQIAGFDIAVTRDLNGLRARSSRRCRTPTCGSKASATASCCPAPSRARRIAAAFDIASRLVGDGRKVVNGITVRGRDQVMLKVTVAEVQRDVIKQLGIDLNGSLGSGTAVLNFNNTNPFSVLGQPLVATNAITARLQVDQRDAARDGARRRHPHARRAEPDRDLGRERELPRRRRIPGPCRLHLRSASPAICQLQIQFKKFGVGLNFTPVVLSRGPHQPEGHDRSVRALERERAHADAVGRHRQTTTLTIPSIKTRRAETTVEIPSGGALAMAGMIQEQTKQQISGMPGLMQLPVLGTLFKSRDYVNRQTELMVIVTPYIVRAVAQKDCRGRTTASPTRPIRPTDPARPPQPHLRRRRPARRPARRAYHGKLRLHSRLSGTRGDDR